MHNDSKHYKDRYIGATCRMTSGDFALITREGYATWEDFSDDPPENIEQANEHADPRFPTLLIRKPPNNLQNLVNFASATWKEVDDALNGRA